MSMNRICRTCGQEEDIRINFGGDVEAEREFHSKDYFCMECRANDMDTLAKESDEYYLENEDGSKSTVTNEQVKNTILLGKLVKLTSDFSDQYNAITKISDAIKNGDNFNEILIRIVFTIDIESDRSVSLLQQDKLIYSFFRDQLSEMTHLVGIEYDYRATLKIIEILELKILNKNV